MPRANYTHILCTVLMHYIIIQKGETAVTLAKSKGHTDIIQLLEEVIRNAAVSQETQSVSVPVLPKNWEVVTSKETYVEPFHYFSQLTDTPESSHPLSSRQIGWPSAYN